MALPAAAAAAAREVFLFRERERERGKERWDKRRTAAEGRKEGRKAPGHALNKRGEEWIDLRRMLKEMEGIIFGEMSIRGPF